MNEKELWIINYLQTKSVLQFVDVLDEDFVADYIKRFEPKSQFIGLGAYKCTELSKLLASMYKKGFLDRWAHGVKSGMWQDSKNFKYPKWVYSYKLK